jgi:hypothetical protein
MVESRFEALRTATTPLVGRDEEDWLIAGQSTWALVVALGPHEVGVRGTRLRLLLSVGIGEG